MYNVVHDLAWESYKTSRRLDIPTFGIINNFLKSLKQRYTWKPSEEQMRALQEAIGIVGQLTQRGECLKELVEQLKKLMDDK